MPKIGISEVRKNQLIQATIECINDYGISETTIAQIAQKANLSTGIISHYFGGKMGLLRETMLDLMRQLHDNIAQKNKELEPKTPKEFIEIIIDCNLQNVQHAQMKVWLSFWAMSMHQPDLKRLQKINDNRLYSNFLFYFKQLQQSQIAENSARGLGALIDGLWLHGSLRTESFNHEQARLIARTYLNHLLEQI